VVALMPYDSANYWASMVRIEEKQGIGLERKGPLNATQIKPQSQLKPFDCDKFFNNMYINKKMHNVIHI
jgi:hypothetical protein